MAAIVIGIAAGIATGRLVPSRKTGRRRKLAAISRARTVARIADLGSNRPRCVPTLRRDRQRPNRSGIRSSSPHSRVRNRPRKQKANPPMHSAANAENAAVGVAEDVDAVAAAGATTITDRTQARTRTRAARIPPRTVRVRNRATMAAAKAAARAVETQRRAPNRKEAWICRRRLKARPSRDASLRKRRSPRRKAVATRQARLAAIHRPRRCGRRARPLSQALGVAAPRAAMNKGSK